MESASRMLEWLSMALGYNHLKIFESNELAAKESPIRAHEVTFEVDNFKGNVIVEFDGWQMLRTQFTFLYERRITDFVFDSIDGQLALKVIMVETGNIEAHIRLRSSNHEVTAYFVLLFDQSYVPDIISQMEAISETNS